MHTYIYIYSPMYIDEALRRGVHAQRVRMVPEDTLSQRRERGVHHRPVLLHPSNSPGTHSTVTLRLEDFGTRHAQASEEDERAL